MACALGAARANVDANNRVNTLGFTDSYHKSFLGDYRHLSKQQDDGSGHSYRLRTAAVIISLASSAGTHPRCPYIARPNACGAMICTMSPSTSLAPKGTSRKACRVRLEQDWSARRKEKAGRFRFERPCAGWRPRRPSFSLRRSPKDFRVVPIRWPRSDSTRCIHELHG